MEVTNHLVFKIVLMDMVIHLDAAMNEDEKPIMWMDLETNHSATSLMAEYSLEEFPLKTLLNIPSKTSVYVLVTRINETNNLALDLNGIHYQ